MQITAAALRWLGKQTASVVGSHFDQGSQWSFYCLWVMFEQMDEILPVVTFGPAEQRAKKENETYFLSECSYRQVLTNTDLYFSKGREKKELLKYFKNNIACLNTAKPANFGFCKFHSSLQLGRSKQAILWQHYW